MNKNWAGNIEYSTQRVEAPTSIAELQALISKEPKVKLLGSRHSFNRIADSEHLQVSTASLTEMSEVDTTTSTITVGGGVNYGKLATHLHHQGYAIHNLASLPHISVAGAIATATHGSGLRNGNLATALVGMKVVTADGSLRSFSKLDNAEEFNSVAIHLGAIGALAELTLKVEPTFQVSQVVYQNLNTQVALNNLEEIAGTGYSVSLFTNWSGDEIGQVWVKSRADQATQRADLLGALPASIKLHPLPEVDPINCTDQLGIPGDWHERLPHFKMEFTPSAGEEMQTEFFVSLSQAKEALAAIRQIGDKITPHLFVSEIRFIAKDDLLMSPAYGRDIIGIHFTWKPDWINVEPAITEVERVLQPFGAAPHLGKLFTMSADTLASVYPRLKAFAELTRSLDPTGKFRNAFLTQIFGE